MITSVYLSSKLAKPCSWDLWCAVRKLIDYVCDHFNEPDMSIWEVRNQKQNFVYSKVMLWVAVDRGLRLAEKRSLPCPQRPRWEATRDQLYEDIMEKVSTLLSKTTLDSFEQYNLVLSLKLDCAGLQFGEGLLLSEL